MKIKKTANARDAIKMLILCKKFEFIYKKREKLIARIEKEEIKIVKLQFKLERILAEQNMLIDDVNEIEE